MKARLLALLVVVLLAVACATQEGTPGADVTTTTVRPTGSG